MTSAVSRVKILDCTLRDGGYVNNWRFSREFVSKYVRCMEAIGVEFVEIGFINVSTPYKNEIVGAQRSLSVADINQFDGASFKIAVMADFTGIDMDILRQKKAKIDLVRVAFHKKHMVDALQLCGDISRLGYRVSANAMAVTNYTPSELTDLFRLVNQLRLDYLYIADSFGALGQTELLRLVETFSANLDHTQIGLHLHNNKQNALSNFEFVQRARLPNLADTTLFGMGRGAGNLPTELAMLVLTPDFPFQTLVDVCKFIQQYIKPIYGIEENKWGYDLDYLVSGFLKMHPNYVGKLRDFRIRMEDRFFLLQQIFENYDYHYFDKDIISQLIEQHRHLLL